MKSTVLYVSQNGVCDHIARSQVIPYLVDARGSGFCISLITAEKPGYENYVKSYGEIFRGIGLEWMSTKYRSKPRVIAHIVTLIIIIAKCLRYSYVANIKVVHGRNYFGAIVGYALLKLRGIPYIFDLRDFSADGGLKKSTGLEYMAYYLLKLVERKLLFNASEVVVLTKAAKAYLCDIFPNLASKNISVVPCCADYSLFVDEKIRKDKGCYDILKEKIKDSDFVLGYLGSVGPDYKLNEMLYFFKELYAIRNNAKFLFIVNNSHDNIRVAARKILGDDSCVIIGQGEREDIPSLISLFDASVVFISPGVPKIGCSPTKLAELFAMNIPVVANAGVGDIEEIFSKLSDFCVLINDFSSIELKVAASKISKIVDKKEVTLRELSSEFTLLAGSQSYKNIYERHV